MNTREIGLETAIYQIAYAVDKMKEGDYWFLRDIVPKVIESYLKADNGFQVLKGDAISKMAERYEKEALEKMKEELV